VFPPESDVLRELDRLLRLDLLSPQECDLLAHIVRTTLAGDTRRLYQKAVAEDLHIENWKQIGVLATRIRAKLSEYYRQPQGQTSVQIHLSARGYEARFSYRTAQFALSDRVQALVADAKAAIDQRTLPGAGSALKFLDRALMLEPGHPLVLAHKAYCHATRALYGTYPRADLETAERIIDETRAAGVRPWESWFAEACVQMALHWNWTAADAAFGQAIALSGGAAQYQPWYAAFLSCQGRASEAVAFLRIAVSRAFDSPIVRADLASAQIHAGQLDDAAETIAVALDLFGPRAHYLLHVHRAILLEARGDSRAALAAVEKAPLRWPRTAITLGFRAMLSGLGGDRQTARRQLLMLKAGRAIAGRHLPAGQLGLAAMGAGDIDGAIHWLREGAEVERDPNFILSNVYPFFRHLHQHPEFRALVVDRMQLKLP
jgi:Tfp pilus assembly protein PilF